jgi:hypothetical protein
MGMDDLLAWNGSWAWGLPLILLNVILHVIGLGLVHAKGVGILSIVKNDCRFLYVFVLVMGVTTILVTLLHASEACIWAGAFRALGVFPDNKSAVLYSLSAITTFGHPELSLAPHWRLMGALEALNGTVLFGLTSAFLYGMVQRVWLVEVSERQAFNTVGSTRHSMANGMLSRLDRGRLEIGAFSR